MTDCTRLARERACAVGGNVIYGWHDEQRYRDEAYVGTITFR